LKFSEEPFFQGLPGSALARFGVQRGKQSYSQAELILRSRFLLRELSKPSHELVLSLCGERIHFARLSTASGHIPPANPTTVYKSFEQPKMCVAQEA
jgi:hypothetical protein